MKKIFAFYGTLRMGNYNYNSIIKGQKGVDYLGEATIPEGYKMFSLGGYPMLMKDETATTPIVVDLFEIDNDKVSSPIERMERGAGYEEHTIEINGMNCVVWVGKPSQLPYLEKWCSVVKSGDWTLEKTGRTLNAAK